VILLKIYINIAWTVKTILEINWIELITQLL